MTNSSKTPSRGRARMVLAAAWCFAVSIVSAQSSRRNANSTSAAGASRGAADADAGRLVFAQRCAICHFSESTAAKIGPGLKGLYARGKFADGKKVNDVALERWIEKGGKDMPGYGGVLKAAQIQALIAYLKTR